MELVKLMAAFFKIGALSFGGGYAMIPFFEEVITVNGWANYSDYSKVIALAQMVPGPFAVDSSAYIGFRVGGLLGASVATVGLMLPSFILLTLVSKYYSRLKSNKLLNTALLSVRPAIIGLLLSAAYIVGLKPLFVPAAGIVSLTLLKAAVMIAAGVILLTKTKINTVIYLIFFCISGLIFF